MKFRLDEQISTDLFEGSNILGIVSTLKNYLLCWHIQQHLQIFFATSEDMQINLIKNSRTYSFTVYDFTDPVTSDKSQLFTNKHDGEFLLPELQHLDYIWVFRNMSDNPAGFSRLQNFLRTIPGIQMVIEIDQSRIKSKNNLLR